MAKRSNNALHIVANDSHTEQPSRQNQPLRIKLDHMKTFDPLTNNQKKFYDAYKRGDYFISLIGSAGTGKSFIAVYKALEEVMDKGNPFTKLVIVRSAVQSRDIGFTPGSLEEKMSLYEQPYYQICSTMFERKDAYQRLVEQGMIEFVSTSFIRGLTFDDAIIMVDECQNMTWEELSTIITRVGYRSKIIFCGDYKQTDLNKRSNDKSGLVKFHSVAKMMSSFTNIEFTTADIVRSSLVKDFLIALDEYEDAHE